MRALVVAVVKQSAVVKDVDAVADVIWDLRVLLKGAMLDAVMAFAGGGSEVPPYGPVLGACKHGGAMLAYIALQAGR